MACVTLKRSLDWESLNQRPAKRRRCFPFGANPSSPTSSSSSSSLKYNETAPSTSTSSPFVEASALTPKLTPGMKMSSLPIFCS